MFGVKGIFKVVEIEVRIKRLNCLVGDILGFGIDDEFILLGFKSEGKVEFLVFGVWNYACVHYLVVSIKILDLNTYQFHFLIVNRFQRKS